MTDNADAKFLALQAEHDAAWAALERVNAMLAAAETSLDMAEIVAAAMLRSEAVDHLHKVKKRIRKTPARSSHGRAIKTHISTRRTGCDGNWDGHALARAVLVLAGQTVQ